MGEKVHKSGSTLSKSFLHSKQNILRELHLIPQFSASIANLVTSTMSLAKYCQTCHSLPFRPFQMPLPSSSPSPSSASTAASSGAHGSQLDWHCAYSSGAFPDNRAPPSTCHVGQLLLQQPCSWLLSHGAVFGLFH